jgi:hypothetical protein
MENPFDASDLAQHFHALPNLGKIEIVMPL